MFAKIVYHLAELQQLNKFHRLRTATPDKGLEPLAVGLKVQRSTTELTGLHY